MAKDFASLLNGIDLNKQNSVMARNLELAQLPTADEQDAQRLEDIAGKYEQNTPVTAILKGIASGAAGIKRSKAEQARDIRLQQIQEQIDYQQKMADHQQQIKDKLDNLALSDLEASRSGKEMANAIQSLQLGDGAPIQNWLAANPNTAKLLGDDGPGGHSFDGVAPVTMHGVQYVQGYGKNPDGSTWQGQPIAVDGLLQRYAPDVYAAKSAAALESAQGKAELQKTQAEARKAGAEAKSVEEGGMTGNQRVQAEMRLADDYRQATKGFTELSRGYNQIKTAYEMAKNDTTGASQISLLYGYMKMLDPTSVVREGEFATAENAPGVPSRILNAYNAVMKGQKIAPEALKSYMDNATSLYKSQGKVQSDIEKQFRDAATRYRLNPDNIIVGAPGATLLDEPLTPPATKGAADTTPTSAPSAQMLTPPSGEGMFKEGQTATNPQTNEKIVFKGGKWLPM